MPQRLVAIDFSSSSIRVAIVDSTLRRAELTAVRTIARDPTLSPDEQLQRVRAALPSEIDSLVVGCNTDGISTRLLGFPFTDLRKVEPAIEFELESQVPYDLDEIATAWQMTDRSAGACRVLAAVATREPLIAQIDQLKAADLEPRAMAIPASALAELAPSATDENVAIIALGDTQTHLAVTRGRNLIYARTLRAGGSDVDRSLAKHFQLELDAACEAKEGEARLLTREQEASASEQEQAVARATTEGLAGLVSQLVSTFKALPEAEQPVRFVLTGGLSRLAGLPEFFADRMGVPVELLDLPSSLAPMEVYTKTLGPEYAVVVAMALALQRHGRTAALNLRQGDLAYQGDLQFYRGQVTRIVAGLAAVILLAIAGSVVRYSMLSAEEARIDQAFCDATRKIIGREICDPTAALATLKQAPGASEGVTIPPHSTADLLQMMSKVIGKDLDASFVDLEFRVDARGGEPDRISGQGEAATFDTIAQMVKSLETDPCVQSAEVARQKKSSSSNRVKFNLTVKVNCPAGVQPGSQVAAAGRPETDSGPE